MVVVQDSSTDKHNESDVKQINGLDNENIARVGSRLENRFSDEELTSDGDPEPRDMLRLKDLIPHMTGKDNVTQLDIILEAIRYIDSLQNKLADKIETGDIVTELVEVEEDEEDS